MIEFRENDATKYENEHIELDAFYSKVVEEDASKFEKHYENWK